MVSNTNPDRNLIKKLIITDPGGLRKSVAVLNILEVWLFQLNRGTRASKQFHFQERFTVLLFVCLRVSSKRNSNFLKRNEI